MAALLVGVLAVGACGDDGDDDEAGSGTTTTTAAATSGGAPAPGGGLTVAEASTSTAMNPLLVHGYVVAQGDDVRLCESLDEAKTPPACGGADLDLEGYDAKSLDGSSGDTRWSSAEVRLLLNRDGDTFTVSQTAR